MIRTTILLTIFVLIPLVACNSQDKESESSKVTKDTKTNLEPKKETSKNSAEVQASGKKDCLDKAGGTPLENKILCDGATNDFPIECFLEAGGEFMEKSITCSGAKSFAPLDCLDQTVLVVRGLHIIHGAILCSGVTKKTLKQRVDCFFDAKEGSFEADVLHCATKGKRWEKYLYQYL